MVFSSLLFLFRFLPITFLIYYIVPFRLKNLVLLIASLIFYSWGEPKYFVIMLSCILVNYLTALGIERFRKNKAICRVCLAISLIFSLGMLFFFKYINSVSYTHLCCKT